MLNVFVWLLLFFVSYVQGAANELILFTDTKESIRSFIRKRILLKCQLKYKEVSLDQYHCLHKQDPSWELTYSEGISNPISTYWDLLNFYKYDTTFKDYHTHCLQILICCSVLSKILDSLLLTWEKHVIVNMHINEIPCLCLQMILFFKGNYFQGYF